MRRILYLSLALFVGIVIGGYQPKYSMSASIPLRDTHENLNAVLWMQTSAEYWALTKSIYGKATVSLASALVDKSWTAIVNPPADYRDKAPAVIMDLDETVFDNSPSQGNLVLGRTVYSDQAWTAWVNAHKAELIPGAKEFIDYAGKAGVTVFFVTNRASAQEVVTIQNLQEKGISTDGEHVLTSGENGWTSDKTKRREYVASNYRVMLLVGDDLGDFISTKDYSVTPAKDKTIAQRLVDTKKAEEMWMSRWVLLPNPTYGSWERATYAGVSGDFDILAKKFTEIKGF